jgi:acetyltransferase
MAPYPAQYVSPWKMKNGAEVLIRPIRPEDEPAMAHFHETLSEQSAYLRFFRAEKLSSRVAHTRLVKRCTIDYDLEMALVAEFENEKGAAPQIIAVGRLVREPRTSEAEVAVLVADAFQRLGLGSELLRRLIQFGRDEKLERITAVVLPDNLAMRSVAAQLGFVVGQTDDLSVVHLVLSL